MIEVRAQTEDDRDWVDAMHESTWGSVHVARLGELIDASACPTFVAWRGDERVGVAAYAIRDGECEVVAISADPRGLGAGRALMDAVAAEARRQACRRLWLTTLDNNDRARAVYERWGMRVARVHEGGVARSRTVKPSIPESDERGRPFHDEIEYEVDL